MFRTLALALLMLGTTSLSLNSSVNNADPDLSSQVDAFKPTLANTLVGEDAAFKAASSTPSDLSLNSFCAALNVASNCLCCSSTEEKLSVNSNLWLRKITNSLLSDSVVDVCNQQSSSRDSTRKLLYSDKLGDISAASVVSSIAQPPKTNILSSFGKLISQRCAFSGQKQLVRESLSQNGSNDYLANDISFPKFPQLSRSSLIASFPQQNSSFVPKSTKLANPAPKTKRIASPFGWRRRPYSNQLQFHQGIDYGAPYGSPVVAVDNGIVTKVVSGCADFGNLFCGGQLGNWIEVDHGNGIVGTYGHLKNSSITVQEGMKVWKNQNIAQVGSSGWSTGAHLDFRFKVNGKHEDPAKYVMSIEPKKELN